MMQKKIIGIAVAAALVAPLAAQAEVKLSGALQAEIASVDIGAIDDSMTITDDVLGTVSPAGGPTKIRFDMSDKLSGGLTAYGQADWSFDVSSGTRGWGARERIIGLKSSSGAYFQLGRIQGVYKTVEKISPFYATSAQMRCGGGESCGSGFTHNAFMDNVIQAGFDGHGLNIGLQYIADELEGPGAPDASVGRAGKDGSFLGSIKYSHKMFKVFAAYSQAELVDDNDATTEDSLTNWKVGGEFNIGGLNLGVQYEDAEMGTNDRGLGGTPIGNMGSAKGQFATVAATYGMGNVILTGWVGAYLDDSETVGADDALSFSLGAIYKFSKNTMAYAAYHSTDSDSTGVRAGEVNATDEYYDWSAFALGIRHGF